jgi:hypothetical protein
MNDQGGNEKTFQPHFVTSLMESLPELDNRWRSRLKILYGDSAWKIGGHHASLPTRECP